MQVAMPVVAGGQQSEPLPVAMMVAVPKPATGEPAKAFKIDVQPAAVAAVSPAAAPAPLRVKVLTPAVMEPVTAPDPPQAAQPSMKVGAAVIAGNILTKVTPVYPQAAKDARVQGEVVLHAIIAKDGTMKSLAVLSGPEELQMSAMEAVRQWTYKPYLLNGEPTEVDTTITVHYNLSGY
jgi:TonB family protein